jgi:hypothetical protein
MIVLDTDDTPRSDLFRSHVATSLRIAAGSRAKPEVISSAVGLVPTNALVLIEQINSRMVNSEAP